MMVAATICVVPAPGTPVPPRAGSSSPTALSGVTFGRPEVILGDGGRRLAPGEVDVGVLGREPQQFGAVQQAPANMDRVATRPEVDFQRDHEWVSCAGATSLRSRSSVAGSMLV